MAIVDADPVVVLEVAGVAKYVKKKLDEPDSAVDAGLTYTDDNDAVLDPCAVNVVLPEIVVVPGPIVTAPVDVLNIPVPLEKSIALDPDAATAPLKVVVPESVRPPAIVWPPVNVVIMKFALPPAS